MAHLIGDFILQPGNWVVEKEKLRYKSNKLYLHVLLHFALIMLLIWNLSFVWLALFISILHGSIDFIKLYGQQEKTKRMFFFIDQLLHLAVLIIAVVLWEKPDLGSLTFSLQGWTVLTALIFLTVPSSIIVKTFISTWSPQIFEKTNDVQMSSLQSAGKAIGIIERLLVFIFIVTSHWEGVGFLITAKSVFRFSDLKQAQDRKLTEYILIGTLFSFGLAVVTGIAAQLLLK